MENLNITIGKKLLYLRKKSKLTQAELAEKLNYSDKAISKWEKGESLPSVEVFYKISKLYGVSLDFGSWRFCCLCCLILLQAQVSGWFLLGQPLHLFLWH